MIGVKLELVVDSIEVELELVVDSIGVELELVVDRIGVELAVGMIGVELESESKYIMKHASLETRLKFLGVRCTH
jgi:hypothetical protein